MPKIVVFGKFRTTLLGTAWRPFESVYRMGLSERH